MLGALFLHNVTPARSEVVQRRVVRFKARRDVALDIAGAEMNHDVHRGFGGELLDDREMQMPRVERIKQSEMEAWSFSCGKTQSTVSSARPALDLSGAPRVRKRASHATRNSGSASAMKKSENGPRFC